MTQPPHDADLASLLNRHQASEDAATKARIIASFITTLQTHTELEDEHITALTHHWLDKSYPDATPPAPAEDDTPTPDDTRSEDTT